MVLLRALLSVPATICELNAPICIQGITHGVWSWNCSSGGGKKNLDGKFWFYFVWAKSANTFFYLSKCGREMILLGWDLLFFYVLVEMQAEQSVETRLTWSTASVTSAVMGFWLTPRVQTTFFGPPHGRAQQRSEKKKQAFEKSLDFTINPCTLLICFH